MTEAKRFIQQASGDSVQDYFINSYLTVENKPLLKYMKAFVHGVKEQEENHMVKIHFKLLWKRSIQERKNKLQ